MEDKQKNTLMAVVAYIIFFIPLLTESKDDPFVKFHVKQGLILLISFIVAYLVVVIPFIGPTLRWLAQAFLFALLVIGIIHALRGEEKPLPLIGKFAENFKF